MGLAGVPSGSGIGDDLSCYGYGCRDQTDRGKGRRSGKHYHWHDIRTMEQAAKDTNVGLAVGDRGAKLAMSEYGEGGVREGNKS